MYKAVFIDLDGTLLDNEKNISKENIEAIERAISKGALVCICSGRQIDITREYKKVAHASKYLICSNGAIIYDDEAKEELYSVYIDKEFCLEAYEYVKKNNLTIRFDTKYGRFVNNENYNTSTEILITEGIEEFIEENNVIQLSIVGSSFEEIDKAKENLYSEEKNIRFGNRFQEEYPMHYCACNCMNDSVSKGNAIMGLCKYLRIDMSEVIAIGDELNDASMVEVAGFGVAMENASEQVKSIAKEISKSNVENGVAYILDKYI